jgi:maltose alpha-D-glucosyltransferase/alpha-amylase
LNQDPSWYKDAVIYEVFVRSFADGNGDGIGDLPGLTAHLDYLQSLGVDTLWLLPITPSPLRDDGYDVSGHFEIHPDYGTLDDFRRFVEEAHRRSLRVVVELIPNHTSDQHPWFQASRDPQHPEHARYRDWYVWSDTDQKYTQARIIFLDSEKSNWTFDEQRGQYYWHRFFYHQPDLNYDHPEVQRAMLRVIQFWIDQGVDGIRVDAPPYLYEREGTSCENLPETHAYLKRLRAFVDAYAPGTMLLSEANQWPEDVRPYFGDGDEVHMNFHFPLMPRIFLALARGERSPLERILGRTPPLPEVCQWATFLRCHDELTLEMVTPEERAFLWDFYAPEARMRLNLGIRRRLAPLLEGDARRIRAAHSILLTLIGTPVLYYGDEIGMGDDIWRADRDGVRTPMQWNDGPNAGFSPAPAERLSDALIESGPYSYQQVNVEAAQADAGSLFNWLQRALQVRRDYPAFGRGELTLLPLDPPALFAYLREYAGERLLVVNNLSAEPQSAAFRLEQAARLIDLFGGEQVTPSADGFFQPRLEAYGFRWWLVRED